MKYVDEFRNKELAGPLAAGIKKMSRGGSFSLMEVCGTHTMAIYKFGLKDLLPPTIKLLSGPGCPVCVTGNDFIDKAIAYSGFEDVIITTFGDMIKVPGSDSSLEKEQANGADVRIVYSPLDAIETAKDNPDKKVIFLGVGFETTAPVMAGSILKARKDKVGNFLVLSAHKVVPPALDALITGKVKIDGFIMPGHVSAIIGVSSYDLIAKNHNIPCVVAGFEPLDVLQGIYMLLEQLTTGSAAKAQIQYNRVVHADGNIKARDVMYEVFETADASWRGLGNIPGSGLRIKKEFSEFDAEIRMPVKTNKPKEPKGCICGAVLKGISTPTDCKLFGKRCTPEDPVGPCMVSSEGTCAAVYKYGR